MLLVTFHGGASSDAVAPGGAPQGKPINNVYAYDTKSKNPKPQNALEATPELQNAELRDLVYANSYLYVVDGSKRTSNILCFKASSADPSKFLFGYVGKFIKPPSAAEVHFKNAIGHPFALEFDGSTGVYFSNQDTNVVARAEVSADFKTASIQSGCQSKYLQSDKLTKPTVFPPPDKRVFLDGTFVASQNGSLPDVSPTTAVPSDYGGLSVDFVTAKDKKVQNSVRDVAISGGALLVCDEPDGSVRIYSLKDGTYLGKFDLPAKRADPANPAEAAKPAGRAKPAHLAIFANGLYASAGDQLYWSSLRDLTKLSFSNVLTAPQGFKVGGIAFDSSKGVAWIAFQKGTGTAGTGAIYSYSLGASPPSPPKFGTGTLLADGFSDTPEFLLYMPDL